MPRKPSGDDRKGSKPGQGRHRPKPDKTKPTGGPNAAGDPLRKDGRKDGKK